MVAQGRTARIPPLETSLAGRFGCSWACVVGCLSPGTGTLKQGLGPAGVFTDAVQRVFVTKCNMHWDHGLPLVADVWVFVPLLLPLLSIVLVLSLSVASSGFPSCTCLFQAATEGSRMQLLICRQARSSAPGRSSQEKRVVSGHRPKNRPSLPTLSGIPSVPCCSFVVASPRPSCRAVWNVRHVLGTLPQQMFVFFSCGAFH